MSSEPVTCGCGEVGGYARGMCQRCYQRHRNRQIAYGRWDPREVVPADAAREHVTRLQQAGIRVTQLARLAGVDHVTVGKIARTDDVRISVQVEAAILAVAVPERAADVMPGKALVPIHGAQRRIQALIAFGYPRVQLARELGMRSNSGAMEALVGHRYRGGGAGLSITAERERAVRAVFDRLQLVAGPSERAQALGRRRGWALPFEWDEPALDDPHGKPVRARWTRASATAERREQVSDLTARGLTTPQIADRLATTERTVERDRVHTKTRSAQQVSQIEAMSALAVQARRDIAARRAGTQRRERTR
jgi:DNA-binding CsgD family transcriptional regulator